MASARVRVLLEIDCPSSWGNECKLDQVFDQGSRETIQGLQNVLAQAGVRARIIGEPEVEAIIVKREKRP